MIKYTCLLVLMSINLFGQVSSTDKEKIEVDLKEILSDISDYYIYLDDKNVDFSCIEQTYRKKIEEIKTNNDKLLFFEYLLDEFYDSHLILNSNTKSSFRLYAPLYVETNGDVNTIKNVWQSQTTGFNFNIIGAEILKFNGRDFQEEINIFPTYCNDKTDKLVRNWIANKVVAGRYNEPRILTLKLLSGKEVEFDLDNIVVKENNQLLHSKIVNDIGVIRINNSLGEEGLIEKFDKTVDSLFNKKGLVIDLRNTVGGGDSYIARAILGRFVNTSKPYQKHWTIEDYGNHPPIERSWIEYVIPRDKCYNKPVVIIVGRWTGSMGEGIAIGLDGMKRAIIVGTEMNRLAGGIKTIKLLNSNFGFHIPFEKMYHLNGVLREKFTPKEYVEQVDNSEDHHMSYAMKMIKSSHKQVK